MTQGTASSSSAIPNVAGASSHVTFVAGGWQVLAVAGAVMVVAAGALVVWRADRMAIMSSRYDAPSGAGNDAATVQAGPVRQAGPAPSAMAAAADSASIWEAMSRGDDPTST